MSNETPKRGPGRPPKPSTALEVVSEQAAALVDQAFTQQDAQALASRTILEHGETLTLVGRIEGLEFTRRVVDVAIAQVFTEIRNNKKYKNIPYQDENGETRHVGDFDEFCRRFLKRSYNRCLELSQNLHLLGPALYEQAEQIGFRAKDYTTLKALPADEQQIVAQAIENNAPREEVLDLLQELAARAQSQRMADKKRIDDLTEQMKAKDEVAAKRAARLDETELSLQRLRSGTPDSRERLRIEREEGLLRELRAAVAGMTTATATFSKAIADLEAEANGVSDATLQAMHDGVTFAFQQVADISQRFDISINFQAMVNPPWPTTTGGDAA